MSEPFPDTHERPADAGGHTSRSSSVYTDGDLVVAPPASAPAAPKPLQGDIEAILERVRASNRRREGAMARLEGMLHQWSATDAVAPEPPRGIVDERPAATPAIHFTQATDTSLMAFESESTVRAQTGMRVTAHGVRAQVDRLSHQVVAWRPEVFRSGREEPRRQMDPGPGLSAARGDVAQMLASRLDALELAIVIVKGELTRTNDRSRRQQRRSSVALWLLFSSVVIAGALIVVSERRVSDASERAAAAQQQAESVRRQIEELAASVKQGAATQGHAPVR